MLWLQLLSEMDDLIEWFAETERQISEAEPIICDVDKLRELSRDHKVILSLLVSFSRLSSATSCAARNCCIHSARV